MQGYILWILLIDRMREIIHEENLLVIVIREILGDNNPIQVKIKDGVDSCSSSVAGSF